MLRKEISYTDFDDNEQTEVFYFNLTRAEIVQMELSGEGNSLAEQMKRISESKNGKKIIETMQNIIGTAYGERSDDGKYFRKSPEIRANFEATAAYSQLWMELTTEAGEAALFINAIVPKNMGNVATDVSEQTPRERSEALMQGHKAPQRDTQKVVPDLPAEPVQESSPKDKPLTEDEINDLPVSDAIKNSIRESQAAQQ